MVFNNNCYYLFIRLQFVWCKFRMIFFTILLKNHYWNLQLRSVINTAGHNDHTDYLKQDILNRINQRLTLNRNSLRRVWRAHEPAYGWKSFHEPAESGGNWLTGWWQSNHWNYAWYIPRASLTTIALEFMAGRSKRNQKMVQVVRHKQKQFGIINCHLGWTWIW